MTRKNTSPTSTRNPVALPDWAAVIEAMPPAEARDVLALLLETGRRFTKAVEQAVAMFDSDNPNLGWVAVWRWMAGEQPTFDVLKHKFSPAAGPHREAQPAPTTP